MSLSLPRTWKLVQVERECFSSTIVFTISGGVYSSNDGIQHLNAP